MRVHSLAHTLLNVFQVLVDRVRKGDYVVFELVVRGGKLVGHRERCKCNHECGSQFLLALVSKLLCLQCGNGGVCGY